MATSPDAPAVARRPQERSMATRRRILDAAIECLVELGYAGTSTVQIQARAGVSRGRLLHHFPSKDELLVAAVGHLAEARLAEAQAQVAAAGPEKDRIDLLVEIHWESVTGPLFAAASELWLAARNHPELRAVLEPAERETGRRIRAVNDELSGPDLNAHPRYRETMDLLLTSMYGAALSHSFDQRRARDEARLAAWKRLARQMLS